MLFKKRADSEATHGGGLRAEPVAAVASKPGVDVSELDRAYEALAALVRVVGRYAHDAPELPARSVLRIAEDWAQHVLVLRAKPGDSRPSRGRDYAALVHFVTEHRKAEHAFMLSSLADLRDTIWAFIHSLNRTLVDDGDSDAKLVEQLARLKRAVQHGSTEELKQAAVSAVSSIEEIAEQRQRRQADRNRELGKKLATLGRQLEDARRKSELDALTQLYNRGALDAYLQQLIQLQAFVDEPSSLLLVDVDHFKHINDGFGHPAGDEVLRRLGECMVRSFLRKNDFVARYGGEEFAVVLPETSADDARMLAERFVTTLRKQRFPSIANASVTVSVGIATLRANDEVSRWIARADRALYEAKKSGRDRICVGE